MDKNDICIATITWARNKAEEKLLKESLQQLALLNIPVIVTDGGSDPDFLKFIQSIPQFTLLTAGKKGVQAQALNSLLAGYNAGNPFLFYTEPDKKDFFASGLPQMLTQITADENTGVVMATRTAESFATFPAFQQITEATINNCCTTIINKKYDYTYGPFALNRKLIPYLDRLHQDVGWGWRPYIFNIANRLNFSVEAMEGNFYCPAEQRGDDTKEQIYRMKQLEQNIRGIILSTEAML